MVKSSTSKTCIGAHTCLATEMRRRDCLNAEVIMIKTFLAPAAVAPTGISNRIIPTERDSFLEAAAAVMVEATT